jgi:hypothetical protein
MTTRAESLIILGIGVVVVVAIVRASSAAQEREARRQAAIEAYRAARAAEFAKRPKFRHNKTFTGLSAAVGGLSGAAACLAGGPLLAIGCAAVGAAGAGASTYFKQRSAHERAVRGQ